MAITERFGSDDDRSPSNPALKPSIEQLLRDPEIDAWLRRIPWYLDCQEQPVEALRRTLVQHAGRIVEWTDRPRFSFVVTLDRDDFAIIDDLIRSFQVQAWPDWQLVCISSFQDDSNCKSIQARFEREQDRRIQFVTTQLETRAERLNLGLQRLDGSWFGALEPSDLLHPLALVILAREIVTQPDIEVVIANDATLDLARRRVRNVNYRSRWSRFALLRSADLGHLTLISRSRLDPLGDPESIFRADFGGFEEFDLALRIIEQGPIASTTVPLVLHYRKSSGTRSFNERPDRPSKRPEHLAKLIREHSRSLYPGWIPDVDIGPTAESGSDPARSESVRLRLVPSSDRSRTPVRVVAFVPFRDQVDLTRQCLDAIEAQRFVFDLTVVLIDNNSQIPETREILETWLAEPRRATYRLVRDEGPFNYAAIHNRAVRAHGQEADLLLLMNNDLELRDPETLATMVTSVLAEPESGFVGIRLMYPDGRSVQHGGLRVLETMAGSGYHAFGHALEPRESIFSDHPCLGVTFACVACRREVWERLGGLEEILVPNAYGDADACLRALALGYQNLYLGTVEAIHHESRTRGRASEEAELMTLYRRHAATLADWRLQGPWRLSQPEWPRATSGQLLGAYSDEFPLRYRIADAINQVAKSVLGPMHRILRGRLIRRTNRG